jgi:hypothetical protein
MFGIAPTRGSRVCHDSCHRMPEDPMKSILDRTFRYTPSFETDLRKTFARIQRERRLAAQSEQPAARPLANVSSIVRNSAALK